jgi:hypothetical protein
MNAVVAFALKQRVLMVALLVFVFVAGFISFIKLNIEAYPDPVPPRVEIITQNPGQSAEEIERYITIPIEYPKLPIAAVLRSRTLSETRGFFKVLVEVNGDRILGFTMIGSEAGEVMAVVQTAMLAGLPHTRLRDAIIAHPTMAEGLTTLFTNLPPR